MLASVVTVLTDNVLATQTLDNNLPDHRDSYLVYEEASS